MQVYGPAKLSQNAGSRTSEELWLPQPPLCQLQGSHLLHRGLAATRLGHKCLPCCGGQGPGSLLASAPFLTQQQTASHTQGCTWSARVFSRRISSCSWKILLNTSNLRYLGCVGRKTVNGQPQAVGSSWCSQHMGSLDETHNDHHN